MGNAIHTSEISMYYPEFEIQSLPYRAPEVLVGLPFTPAIDMWSLGVLIAELCIGQTLFVCTTREEMVRQISTKIGTFCPVKFSGGMFSHILTDTRSHLLSPPNGLQAYAPMASSFCYSTHLKSVKRLLQKHLPASAHSALSYEFVHFLSGLLMLDPKLRLTPLEALSHPFLSEHMPIPLSLIAGNDSNQNESSTKRPGNYTNKSVGSSGNSTSQSRMTNASIAVLRRNSLHNNSLVPRSIPRKPSVSNHHMISSADAIEAHRRSKYDFVSHSSVSKGSSKEIVDLSETESFSTSDSSLSKRSYGSETYIAPPVSKFSKFM